MFTIFTDKQKKEYLKDSVGCPVCKDHSIIGETITREGTTAMQRVACKYCGFRWRDIYQLVDVIEEIN